MRNIIYIPLLFVFVLLASCNKQKQQEPTSHTSVICKLNLEADIILSEEQMRALEFDTTHSVPKLLAQSDWTTHCFLRKKGDPSFVGYARVDWEVISSEGGLKLRQKNSEVTIENTSGKTPMPNEEWYIAGIAGGGELNSEKTKVDFTYKDELDKSLASNKLRLPLAFLWTKLTISTSGLAAKVHFKPQGSLIHMKGTNKSGVSLNTYVGVVSNALDRNGSYDFSATSDDITVGSDLKWNFNSSSATTATIKFKVVAEQNAEFHSLAWGMPRELISVGVVTEGEPGGFRLFRAGTTNLFSSDKAFASHKSHLMKVDIFRPLLSLEFVAERNMAQDVIHFASSDANSGPSGYFSWADAKDKYDVGKGFTVDGVGYHLPSRYEWEGIFPMDHNATYIHSEMAYSDDLNKNKKETIDVQGGKNTYMADYKGGKDGKNIYGIRFQKASEQAENGFPPAEDNRRRCAFRYEWVENPNSPIPAGWGSGYYNMLKVTCRFLGDAQATLDVISTPTYWESNSQNDVVRIFPLCGYNGKGTGATGTILNQNVQGHYWTSSPSTDYPEQNAAFVQIREAASMLVTGNTKKHGFAIRLFRDK